MLHKLTGCAAHACLCSHQLPPWSSYTLPHSTSNSTAALTPQPPSSLTTPSLFANTCPTFQRHDAQPQAAAVACRRRKTSFFPFLPPSHPSPPLRYLAFCPFSNYPPKLSYPFSLLASSRKAHQNCSKTSSPLSAPASPQSAPLASYYCRHHLLHRRCPRTTSQDPLFFLFHSSSQILVLWIFCHGSFPLPMVRHHERVRPR